MKSTTHGTIADTSAAFIGKAICIVDWRRAVCCAAITLLMAYVSVPLAAQDSGAESSSASTVETSSAIADGKAAAEKEGDKAPSPAPLPIPLRPYEVHVELGFPELSSMPKAESLQLLANLKSGVGRIYGSMWRFDAVISDWFLPGRLIQLRGLTAEELHQRYGESELHKVMVVSVEARDGGFQVSCREYDVRVQELTPVQTSFTFDHRSIPDLAAQLIRDSFRPVTYLAASVQGTDELEFFLQAGELVPPDPTAAQIAPGDVLRPFLRHMERREPTRLRLLQRLDLTYIRVTEFNRELTATGISEVDEDVTVENASADSGAVFIDRGRLKGVLVSHGAAPFGGRGRNVEQIALRQRPMASDSEVQLVLRLREDRPLVCFRVDKVAKLRYKDESDVPAERLVSDREGKIKIDVDPQNPTFWLYVYSGSLLLARVPYAPGLLETDVIKLPDDSIRLNVEGELYLFRDRLVDVVAQQAVFKGLAKQAAAAGNVAQLDETIKGLEALDGKKEFEARLNAIRRPAIDRAKELKNRSAERTVNRLCDAMSSSLEKFFSSEKQVQQMQEIQQLRNLASQRSAGGN